MNISLLVTIDIFHVSLLVIIYIVLIIIYNNIIGKKTQRNLLVLTAVFFDLIIKICYNY